MNDESLALTVPKEKFKFIIEQTNQILHLIKQNDNYYRDKCFLISIELLLNTLAALQTKEKAHEVTSSLLVRKFKQLVKTNYHNRRLVSWYSDALNVSSKHLSNQVKKEQGVSAKEYILKIIINSVKRQLLNTDKSFKEIAFEHQYDPSAMGKLFKSNVGYTMKAYKSYEV